MKTILKYLCLLALLCGCVAHPDPDPEHVAEHESAFVPYPAAVGAAFGVGAVDFAVVQKNYRRGARADGQPSDHRYEPPRQPFITRRAVFGVPDVPRASTSHVERQNLTMRMQIRRMTRLCNGCARDERARRRR